MAADLAADAGTHGADTGRGPPTTLDAPVVDRRRHGARLGSLGTGRWQTLEGIDIRHFGTLGSQGPLRWSTAAVWNDGQKTMSCGSR